MADLRIADAPEIDESEVQGGLKLPTGGFGNKAINMNTVANWVVKDKDLPSKGYVDDKFNQGNQGLAGHVANKNNPHEVTKEQIGLGNVDNTADVDKPVSNAASAALNLKADKTQLDLKADKTYVDNQLNLKADISRVDTIETYLEDSKALSQYDGKYEFDAAYAEKIGGYPLNARIMLTNGDIVQNTQEGNTNNPNISMGGWKSSVVSKDVTVPTYKTAADGVNPVTGVADGAYFNVRSEDDETAAIEYQNVNGSAVATGKSYPSSKALTEVKQKQIEQGKRIAEIAVKFLLADDIGLTKWTEFKKPPYSTEEYKQAYDNGVNLTSAIKAAHDAGYGGVVLERGNYPLLYTNETGGTFTNNRFGAVKVRDVSYMNVNLNGSTMFVIFDSNNRNPYDNATAQAPYQLHGAVFDTENVREVTFSNGIVRGDQYMRSWVTGENMTEQTYGFFLRGNSVGVYFDKVTMTGFRGDGIGGQGRGVTLHTLTTWQKGGVSPTGDIMAEEGAYHTGMLTINRSAVIDDSIQINSTSIRAGAFRDPNLKIFFYRESNSFISSEWVRQCDFIYLPKDCTKVIIVAYGDERTDATVTYGNYILLATGTSDKVYAEHCEFYENHRGGISNLFGNAVFEKCYFHDIGYGKQGFPNYGDPTRFGIDFENVYVHSLTVRDCVFRNVPQGALGGVRDFIVDNCLLENLEYAGTLAYACSKAIFTGNTYRDVGFAFGYQNSSTYLPKSLVASGNILERCGVIMDISTYPNVKYSIHDNEFKDKCSIILTGDGNNLGFYDNTIYNPTQVSNLVGAITVINSLRNSNNVFVCDSGETRYDYFGFVSTVGDNNNFIDNRNNTTRIKEPLQANEIIYLNFLNLRSNSNKVYQNRLTNKSKGWATHVDNYRTTKVGMDNIRYELYGLDGQNHYNTVAVLDEVNFKNNAHVVLSKREGSSYPTSTTDIVIKNSHIDLTSATRLIFITYAQLGVCTIKFINCTFISDTPKSISFIQGQTANITATATNCQFINVTNTDSILQINGTAKVAYDPPSLANGVQQSTTVSLAGAKVGDNVNVSFDKTLNGTRMWGEVTSADTVTVYHRNDTGAVVDVGSGTITAKVV